MSFLQRVNKEGVPITDDIVFRNYFIVSFPDELGIRYYDVISVDFLEDNICRFTIRNNSETYPLYYINKYKHKMSNIFKLKKDNIEICQLNKNGLVIGYKNILTNISIKKIIEQTLDYRDEGAQEIILDIKYKKRILTKNATTEKRN